MEEDGDGGADVVEEEFDVVVVAAPQTEDKTRIKGASL